MYTYTNIKYFYFLLIMTLINPYDKNDKQHIIERAHGIIDIIIIIKGDISINKFSSVQLFDNILSSVIFIIFIYTLLNLILGYFRIKG